MGNSDDVLATGGGEKPTVLSMVEKIEQKNEYKETIREKLDSLKKDFENTVLDSNEAINSDSVNSDITKKIEEWLSEYDAKKNNSLESVLDIHKQIQEKLNINTKLENKLIDNINEDKLNDIVAPSKIKSWVEKIPGLEKFSSKNQVLEIFNEYEEGVKIIHNWVENKIIEYPEKSKQEEESIVEAVVAIQFLNWLIKKVEEKEFKTEEGKKELMVSLKLKREAIIKFTIKTHANYQQGKEVIKSLKTVKEHLSYVQLSIISLKGTIENYLSTEVTKKILKLGDQVDSATNALFSKAGDNIVSYNNNAQHLFNASQNLVEKFEEILNRAKESNKELTQAILNSKKPEDK